MVANAQKQKHDLRAVTVTPTHVHLIIELPDDPQQIREIVGWMKRFATRAIREVTDAFDACEIWAGGEAYEPIDSHSHLHTAIHYVLTRQGEDAWTWTSPQLAA